MIISDVSVMEIETSQIIGLGVAALSGFFIGIEREWRGKSAGLTTNTLVALGAAIFVTLSFNLSESHENVDVSRIVAQVVSGIGFLGAGIIFKEGLTIHGLTTAATLWCSASIGAVSASGDYVLAAISTLLVLAVNLVLNRIDNMLHKKNERNNARKSNENTL